MGIIRQVWFTGHTFNRKHSAALGSEMLEFYILVLKLIRLALVRLRNWHEVVEIWWTLWLRRSMFMFLAPQLFTCSLSLSYSVWKWDENVCWKNGVRISGLAWCQANSWQSEWVMGVVALAECIDRGLVAGSYCLVILKFCPNVMNWMAWGLKAWFLPCIFIIQWVATWRKMTVVLCSEVF